MDWRLKSYAAVCLTLFLPLLGCQDYYFSVVPLVQIEEGVLRQSNAKPVPADILFVVDNSCSMEDEQENLARNFQAFISEIAGTGDYRIAIVTTDVSSEDGEKVGLSVSSFDSVPPYFSSHDADRSGCKSAGISLSCFRGHDPSKRIVSSNQSASAQIETFSNNVKVGSCGSGTEAGLEAVSRALNRMQVGCNRGFMRDEANLVVVIVSDEDDHSNRGVRTYVEHLLRQKEPEKIRFALIGGLDSHGAASNCRVGASSCGSLCDYPAPANDSSTFRDYCQSCAYYNTGDCCNAESASRYLDFATRLETRIVQANPSLDATGCLYDPDARPACLIDSICQEEFSDTLSRIARDLVIQSEYLLDEPACNPDGVVVKINGVEIPKEDVMVSADGERVRIRGASQARPDDLVEIFFVVSGCEE
jgi:hypothetical protein